MKYQHAFPLPFEDLSGRVDNGMKMIDYIAFQVLPSIILCDPNKTMSLREVAAEAYDLAEEVMEERRRRAIT